jgi:L-ribulose-5-phosphate 4-epimerase
MLDDLKKSICDANRALPSSGLVCLTWGNVSGIDRDAGIFGIKPSGVDYNALVPDDIVLLDLDGNVVEGKLNPSSDTKTHLALYRAWEGIGGVTHTHSPSATAWSQANKGLPCFGTTHADHFCGTVPICRALTAAEVDEDYEANTGKAIIEHFAEHKIDPKAVPAVLQLHHAPFTWGKNAGDSLKNSIALEMCARMGLDTLTLSPETQPIPQHILDKHYMRKHGPGAYYGQK